MLVWWHHHPRIYASVASPWKPVFYWPKKQPTPPLNIKEEEDEPWMKDGWKQALVRAPKDLDDYLGWALAMEESRNNPRTLVAALPLVDIANNDEDTSHCDNQGGPDISGTGPSGTFKDKDDVGFNTCYCYPGC
jgi:hypothetical protein